MITPLRVEHWESVLALHPDKPYVDYIVHGIRYGFRVGFVKTGSISSAQRNTHSANENPSVVSKYLAEEQERGVVLGPFKNEEIPDIHINRFGVIPKSSQPGKWRLILDLSHPEGKSVNNFIYSELCSLQNVRVEDVVRTESLSWEWLHSWQR